METFQISYPRIQKFEEFTVSKESSALITVMIHRGVNKVYNDYNVFNETSIIRQIMN